MIIVKLDTTEARKARVEIIKDQQKLIVILGDSPLPTIQKALFDSKLELKDIDQFESDPGPGSFTGVRIGAAVANALNFALNKEVGLIKPVYG